MIDQVPQERDVAFSLLSMNTAMNVAAAEWESEWNQAGLSSRLSEQVKILLLGSKWASRNHFMICASASLDGRASFRESELR